MRKIQILGLALAAVFAFSAVAAASAFAESEWLDNGVSITTAVPTETSLSALLLEDMGVKTQVLCEGILLGSVGPGAKDEVTAVDDLTCVFEKAELCEEAGELKVEPVHLPWLSTIALVGVVVWDNITADGAGAPGWLVVCHTFLGKEEDECTTETGRTLMENTTGGVNATFTENESGEATCKGVPLAGKGLVLSENGPALNLAIEPGLVISIG